MKGRIEQDQIVYKKLKQIIILLSTSTSTASLLYRHDSKTFIKRKTAMETKHRSVKGHSAHVRLPQIELINYPNELYPHGSHNNPPPIEIYIHNNFLLFRLILLTIFSMCFDKVIIKSPGVDSYSNIRLKTHNSIGIFLKLSSE